SEIVSLTRRHEIDRALLAASPIDLDAARAVAQMQIKDADDVAKAVHQLKASKPFLFEPTGNAPGPRQTTDARHAPSVMTPAPEPRTARDEAQSLADEARTTGDRRALLAYLRARRSR
ncbi:MAG: hypothetical protein PSX37_00860, partial [bacterium]|nr:hypothetical protein [bacterium]